MSFLEVINRDLYNCGVLESDVTCHLESTFEKNLDFGEIWIVFWPAIFNKLMKNFLGFLDFFDDLIYLNKF